MVKVYCNIETSPYWALTLTEPVPEAFKLPASDWPEKKFFWPISEEKQLGDSRVSLHDVVFLIDRHSWKVSEQNVINPEKLQPLPRLQETNTPR